MTFIFCAAFGAAFYTPSPDSKELFVSLKIDFLQQLLFGLFLALRLFCRDISEKETGKRAISSAGQSTHKEEEED